ncbi:PRD domain-containing protein (plasmid) [Entomospira entomophila]|uniref:PRD domain-containing protein n=1 Tax=Entomospira entomophila TaxID=2719988 RepID=A0A968KUH4_9SPIO|nr:PRD domain-containing protein [Entomospira entomophilus]NIZ41476.1 PRD domain-containing protein [Entomospira entomophilus]WDI36310.1 PRD domain-containing protein [Entomospira entomophilus]
MECIIKQVFNNNVALVMIDGYEMVVTGRGIAFQKQAGGRIDRDQIERYFVLQDINDFKESEVLTKSELEARLLQIVMRCLRQQEDLWQRLHDRVDGYYSILLDHLLQVVESSHQESVTVKRQAFVFTPEVRMAYASEVSCARQIVQAVEQSLDVTLGEEEVILLSLHLVHAQQDHRHINETLEASLFLQDFLWLLKEMLSPYWQDDSWLVERFIVHIRLLVWRLYDRKSENHELRMTEELLAMMKEHYPQANAVIDRVQQFLHSRLAVELNLDEELYLRMHLRRLMKESD